MNLTSSVPLCKSTRVKGWHCPSHTKMKHKFCSYLFTETFQKIYWADKMREFWHPPSAPSRMHFSCHVNVVIKRVQRNRGWLLIISLGVMVEGTSVYLSCLFYSSVYPRLVSFQTTVFHTVTDFLTIWLITTANMLAYRNSPGSMQ